MSQSIDLSAIKNCSFNGADIKTINLNGQEIWTGGGYGFFSGGIKLEYNPPQPSMVPVSSEYIDFVNTEGNLITSFIEQVYSGLVIKDNNIHLAVVRESISLGLDDFTHSGGSVSLVPHDRMVFNGWTLDGSPPLGWVVASGGGDRIYVFDDGLIELDASGNLVNKTQYINTTEYIEAAQYVTEGWTNTGALVEVYNNTINYYRGFRRGQSSSALLTPSETKAEALAYMPQANWDAQARVTYNPITKTISCGKITRSGNIPEFAIRDNKFMVVYQDTTLDYSAGELLI